MITSSKPISLACRSPNLAGVCSAMFAFQLTSSRRAATRSIAPVRSPITHPNPTEELSKMATSELTFTVPAGGGNPRYKRRGRPAAGIYNVSAQLPNYGIFNHDSCKECKRNPNDFHDLRSNKKPNCQVCHTSVYTSSERSSIVHIETSILDVIIPVLICRIPPKHHN